MAGSHCRLPAFELTDDEKTKAVRYPAQISFSAALEQPLFTAVPSQSELGNSVARGKNNGTMGPMDVDFDMPHKPYGMHVYAKPRHHHATQWKTVPSRAP